MKRKTFLKIIVKHILSLIRESKNKRENFEQRKCFINFHGWWGMPIWVWINLEILKSNVDYFQVDYITLYLLVLLVTNLQEWMLVKINEGKFMDSMN